MKKRLTHVTILVRDEDEALRWYVEKLGFERRSNQIFGLGVRWVTVAPREQDELEIVLQKPDPALHGDYAKELMKHVGKGTTWVLSTDDCQKTYEALQLRGVKFSSPPQNMSWEIQAVFEDRYGNSFALVEPR